MRSQTKWIEELAQTSTCLLKVQSKLLVVESKVEVVGDHKNPQYSQVQREGLNGTKFPAAIRLGGHGGDFLLG